MATLTTLGRRSISLSMLLAIIVLTLAGCGGSNGLDEFAVSPLGQTTVNDESLTPASGSDSPQALPNLVVADFVTSRETRRGDLSVFVTIANTGEASISGLGTLRAWLLVSQSNDFSSGYHLNDVTLFPAEDGDGILEPGEQETFTASYGLQGDVELETTRLGTHYAQLWVNPDLSALFQNPEDSVVPSYTVAEYRYDDNRSSIVSFEIPVPTSITEELCEPDTLEENDTLATAAPIALDTQYVVNACDDLLDVFSFELDAGQVIEIMVTGEGASYWSRSVVAPDDSYLVRNGSRGDTIIQAETAGTYYLVLYHIWYSIKGEGAREATFVLKTLR